MPAGDDERRYFVLEVSPKHLRDIPYFEALTAEIDNGGAEAFFADMLAVKLGTWHPRRDIPQTAALAGQQEETAGPEVHWLRSLLDDGTIREFTPRTAPGGRQRILVNREGPDTVHARAFYDWMRSARGGLERWSDIKIKRLLVRFGARAERRAGGVILLFPPLEAMRAAFAAAYPWLPAFETNTEGDVWHDPRVKLDYFYEGEDFD